MKKLYSLFVIVFLHACNVDKSKKVDFAKLDFNTQEASELYFKNVRQSSYFIEEKTEAGLVLYRNKRWLKSGDAFFTPVIVHNWRQDKAYMLIEWDEGEKEAPIALVIKQPGKTTDSIFYEPGNTRSQLEFLTAVYNSVIENTQVAQVSGGELTPFFSTEAQRQTFRVILFDYYRLTGVY